MIRAMPHVNFIPRNRIEENGGRGEISTRQFSSRRFTKRERTYFTRGVKLIFFFLRERKKERKKKRKKERKHNKKKKKKYLWKWIFTIAISQGSRGIPCPKFEIHSLNLCPHPTDRVRCRSWILKRYVTILWCRKNLVLNFHENHCSRSTAALSIRRSSPTI